MVKAGMSEEHIVAEMAADAVYRAAGINVPEFRSVRSASGKLYKIAEFIEGKDLGSWWKKASEDERKRMSSKLAEGMDVDAMLGNWNVIGMSGDNILVDKDGNPWRIDNGGSLSFRAQGEKKTGDQWSQWTDDFFTIASSPNNKAYTGDAHPSALYRQAGKRDWDALLKELPENERETFKERIKEVKEQALRAQDLADGGYTDKYADSVLKATNDLCKDGYREAVPWKITYGDYGNCRPTRSGYSAPQQVDYGDLALAAAKTINYHAKDGAYNQAKINAFLGKKGELEAIYKATKDPGANYYLGVIKRMEDSIAQKGALAHIDASIEVRAQQTQKPAKQRSLTERAIDYIGQKDWNDYIAKWTGAQAGNSWNDFAIKRKVVEYHAMGMDVKTLDKPPKGVWNGKDAGDGNWRYDHYKDVRAQMTDKEIERFAEVDAKMRAATMLMLESADFNGNYQDKRKVVLFRTERESDVFKDETPTVGKVIQYDTSPAESYSWDHTVYIGGADCATACAVPYSRINASYFMSREANGRSMFLGDGEAEFNVNAVGLDRVFISRGNKRHKTSEILSKKKTLKPLACNNNYHMVQYAQREGESHVNHRRV